MEILVEADRLRKTFGADHGRRRHLAPRGQGRGAGLSRAQRRRQVDDHEDADRLPRAGQRSAPASAASTSPSAPKAAKAKIGYLPEGAPAYGDMTAGAFLRFIAEIRGFDGAARSATSRGGHRAHRPRRRARPAHRDAVEGLQAPRRPRPGDPARPAGADHGRADRRPRSQPEASRAPLITEMARTRRSSSRRTSSRRWRRSARAPSSSTAAASSPTARPRICSGACPITTPWRSASTRRRADAIARGTRRASPSIAARRAVGRRPTATCSLRAMPKPGASDRRRRRGAAQREVAAGR